MTNIDFNDLDFHYADTSLVVRPDSSTNINIPLSSIIQVHLGHANRNKFPFILIELNNGETIRIDGYQRFRSTAEEREAYRDFVIDFHKRLIPHKREIKFTGGIDMPKSVSIILSVVGSALLVYNVNREFYTAEGIGFPIAMIVVGMIAFLGKGHNYDPDKIPGKYLR